MENIKNLLEVKNLKKYFPAKRKKIGEKKRYVKAVDGVSFAIKEGETLGLVGESGCGKSTTGQALIRLIEPTSGEIIFDGKNITQGRRILKDLVRKEMQIIFQDPYSTLNPRKKIGWTLREPLVINKIGTLKEQNKKIDEMLDVVGFDASYKKRYPHELSGGQRQRIGIARALMLNPQFIVADEPVSALDVSVQSQVLNLMKDLQTKFDLTYLFISHDLNVVEYLSDRVAVMYLGKIIEIADVEEIYRKPLHPYTQSLLSSIPSTKVEDDKERIILEGDVPSPLNPPSGCSFHPRCPKAMDICSKEAPIFKEYIDGHKVSCHLY
jgi:oligopeptide/dipeptide ABC transporter ATP-binding protein